MDSGSGLTVLIPVQRVRYTHDSVNEEFVHGSHRGKNIEEVVTRLKSEQESPLSKDSILGVVPSEDTPCLRYNGPDP